MMKYYDVVLFDLDGTLVDTGLGITNSVMYSLKKFGIEVKERQSLYKFVGPPLHKSFEKFYGFSSEKAMQAVEYYREYYKNKGMFEITVYNGIENLLKTLKSTGKTLAVATSKPEVFAKRILKHIDFDKYFDIIAGANLDGTRTQKSEVVEYALKSCNATNLSKVVIIGDREYDVYGAYTVGIDSVGVTFGYGNRAELENAGANYIADSAENLIKLFTEDN
ncbi:MAG: HAD family hydrolase [Acutalibacteraceae bacterium]|nr:HAD family hydrolase [Acutalibacteraceae bacterium]